MPIVIVKPSLNIAMKYMYKKHKNVKCYRSRENSF